MRRSAVALKIEFHIRNISINNNYEHITSLCPCRECWCHVFAAHASRVAVVDYYFMCIWFSYFREFICIRWIYTLEFNLTGHRLRLTRPVYYISIFCLSAFSRHRRSSLLFMNERWTRSPAAAFARSLQMHKKCVAYNFTLLRRIGAASRDTQITNENLVYFCVDDFIIKCTTSNECSDCAAIHIRLSPNYCRSYFFGVRAALDSMFCLVWPCFGNIFNALAFAKCATDKWHRNEKVQREKRRTHWHTTSGSRRQNSKQRKVEKCRVEHDCSL